MGGYDRTRLQVLIGGRDKTERCDSLTFSATDPGGFEIATLGLPAADRPRKGDSVIIRSGLDVTWAGRVAEVSDHSQHGRATKTIGCEGSRALLRDTLVQMVYVDRDLTRFTPDSIGQQANVLAAGFGVGSFKIAPDAVGGLPALNLQIDGAWGSTSWPLTEAWYDAGPGNLISKIYYSETDNVGLGAGGWQGSLQMGDTDSSFVSQTNIMAGSGYWAPGSHRYATVFFTNGIKPGGIAGDTFYMTVLVALYGNHGLTGRGADPVGFYPSDIAKHALAQCAGVDPGVIPEDMSFIVPHAVYRTPTPADTLIDDMARLMGWTWGVWEPITTLGSRPRLDFRPPPPDATAVVMKAECDQLDITSRLGDLYNMAQVAYIDPAGQLGVSTVTLANAQLNEAGIAARTLVLSMGPGSAAAATAFATFALALSQNSARAAGQATLPVSVRLPNGGSKPAHLLRPGIDRLRIADLVDGGSLLDVGTVRRDVFRIARTETTVGADGTPATRVELDSGSNLLETLQARLSLADGVVGAGASG